MDGRKAGSNPAVGNNFGIFFRDIFPSFFSKNCEKICDIICRQNGEICREKVKNRGFEW